MVETDVRQLVYRWLMRVAHSGEELIVHSNDTPELTLHEEAIMVHLSRLKPTYELSRPDDCYLLKLMPSRATRQALGILDYERARAKERQREGQRKGGITGGRGMEQIASVKKVTEPIDENQTRTYQRAADRVGSNRRGGNRATNITAKAASVQPAQRDAF
ncbi:MAG: hypothetical protein ABIG44_07900 [Planctomycetota bacterium]